MKKLALAAILVAALSLGAAAQQTVKVLLWDDPLSKIIQANIPDFEKATGYKVEIEMVAPPQVLTKTSVGVTASSSDYDVVPMDEGNIPVFASLRFASRYSATDCCLLINLRIRSDPDSNPGVVT